MRMFKPDLYRNFAIGFGAGAVAVVVSMVGEAGGAARLVIAAFL